MKIMDNLYAYLWPGLTVGEMMRFGNNANSYIISSCVSCEGKSNHTIIDPGHITNETGIDCIGRLFEQIRNDGIKPEDIKFVINTHCHQDHCEASAYFQEKYAAKVAVGENEVDFLKGRRQGFQADIILKEGELVLGDTKLQIINTPGHSPGSISIFWSDKKVLISGDVIFYENTGRVDLPGGDGNLLKQSIEKLSTLELEYILTGHQYQSPGIIEGSEEIKNNFAHIRQYVFPYL